jgi:hypothetical protein
VLTSEWEVRNPTRRVVVVDDVVSWSQPTAAVPRLELTPFWDRWHRSGRLVDPVSAARAEGLPVAGHTIDVSIRGGRFALAVDGRRAGRGRLGEPVSVSF